MVTTILALLLLRPPHISDVRMTDLSDLVGARGSTGQAELEARGYVNVGGRIGEDAVWTWWWHQADKHCATVITQEGRFRSVTTEPPAVCRVGPDPVSRTETLSFARGTSGARREGQIQDGERITYSLSLRAGQRLRIELDCAGCSFDLQAPLSSDLMHKGDVQGTVYSGLTPLNGLYTVTLFRPTTASGSEASYRLDVSAR